MSKPYTDMVVKSSNKAALLKHLQNHLQACRLYYVDGWTQKEGAELMETSHTVFGIMVNGYYLPPEMRYCDDFKKLRGRRSAPRVSGVRPKRRKASVRKSSKRTPEAVPVPVQKPVGLLARIGNWLKG